jgi:hypothetical protein
LGDCERSMLTSSLSDGWLLSRSEARVEPNTLPKASTANHEARDNGFKSVRTAEAGEVSPSWMSLSLLCSAKLVDEGKFLLVSGGAKEQT